MATVREIFSVDGRSAALLRIFLGFYIVLDAINRIYLTPAFYSDSGVIPRSAMPLVQFEHAYHFQLLFLSGGEWFSVLFFTVLAISGFCLLAGYKTRFFTILCWFLVCTANVRDSLTINSGDILLMQLLFWSMFLPLGRFWSADSRFRKSVSSNKKNFFSAATVAIHVQFILLYITSGIFKGQYSSWIGGSHLYITFSRFELMTPLSEYFYYMPDLLSLLTKATLVLELFGPLLLFIPFAFLYFRMIGIILFLGLQLSILFLMNVGFFPIASIAGIVVLIPTEFWEKAKRTVDPGNYKNETPKKIHSNTWRHIREFTLYLILAYVVLWNISELPKTFDIPEKLKKPAYFLKLDQKWAMFSATPIYGNYYSVPATLSDGNTIDLLADYKKEYERSDGFEHVVFKNFRWRKYISDRLDSDKYEHLRSYFVDYLVREASKKLENRTILKASLVAHRHMIQENYNHSEVLPYTLYTKTYDTETGQ